jgi:hypothetical protein
MCDELVGASGISDSSGPCGTAVLVRLQCNAGVWLLTFAAWSCVSEACLVMQNGGPRQHWETSM